MAEKRVPKQKQGLKSNPAEINVSYEFERQDDTLIVHLAGEADLSGSSKLRRALSRKLNGINKIIFDLSKLEFADSYFLRLLIVLRKRLGGVSSVKVRDAHPNIRRIFEITGLDKLFMQED
jgi:anti-sigma B factor antagonist